MAEASDCRGRKQVLAGTGTASKRQRCPNDSNSQKKKLLSQVTSPTPNFDGRMDAAVLVSCGSIQPVRTTSTTSTKCGSVPLQDVYTESLQRNPNICVIASEAEEDRRQENLFLDPLVTARKILKFTSSALKSQSAIEGQQCNEDTSFGLQMRSPGVEEIAVEVPGSDPLVTLAEGLQSNKILQPSLQVLEGVSGTLPLRTIEEGLTTHVSLQAPESKDEGPIEVAVENTLSSGGYGTGLHNGLSQSSGNYSKEFIDHLLSFVPPEDLPALMRTHAMQPLRNLPPSFEAHDTEQLPTEEVPCMEINVPCLRRNDLRQEGTMPATSKGAMVSKRQFEEKLRELARDEKKYKKKQKKQQAKELEAKSKAKSTVQKEVLPRSPLTPRPFQPLTTNLLPMPSRASARQFSSPARGSPHPQAQKKKDLISSSGASCGIQVSSASTNFTEGNDLGNWGVHNTVPPFEVNLLAAPIGEFWEYMRCYVFEQAAIEFPWHIDWNKQCPKLKTRFTLQLRKIYPGPWDHTSVLKAIGANLRERRTRLRRKFDKVKNPKQVSRPAGCSHESWMQIYESTKDTRKQKKSQLCKNATNERLKVQGFTHRCGPGGMKSLYDRFVDYCNRPPTDEELEYGKLNGWLSLKQKITTSETSEGHDVQNTSDSTSGSSSSSHDSHTSIDNFASTSY